MVVQAHGLVVARTEVLSQETAAQAEGWGEGGGGEGGEGEGGGGGEEEGKGRDDDAGVHWRPGIVIFELMHL
jgi:hypothetical protein